MMVSRWILLKMRNVSGKFVEKIKAHFMFNNFFPECPGLYEIIWKKKYIVELDRPQMTI